MYDSVEQFVSLNPDDSFYLNIIELFKLFKIELVQYKSVIEKFIKNYFKKIFKLDDIEENFVKRGTRYPDKNLC